MIYPKSIHITLFVISMQALGKFKETLQRAVVPDGANVFREQQHIIAHRPFSRTILQYQSFSRKTRSYLKKLTRFRLSSSYHSNTTFALLSTIIVYLFRETYQMFRNLLWAVVGFRLLSLNLVNEAGHANERP